MNYIYKFYTNSENSLLLKALTLINHSEFKEICVNQFLDLLLTYSVNGTVEYYLPSA